MKIKSISLILFLLTTHYIHSQSFEPGIGFSFCDTRIFSGCIGKYNKDFLNKKIINGNLEYDYSIFNDDPYLNCINTIESPFILQFIVSKYERDSYVKKSINIHYALYVRYFNNKHTGIGYRKEYDFINDTAISIFASINECSKDLVFGGNVSMEFLKKRHFELYAGVDLGIGGTLNNKIKEYVSQYKYIYNKEYPDNRQLIMDENFQFSIKTIVENEYKAQTCIILNLGALIGVKIPIYKGFGLSINHSYSILYEYQLNNSGIFKRYLQSGFGLFYRINNYEQ